MPEETKSIDVKLTESDLTNLLTIIKEANIKGESAGAIYLLQTKLATALQSSKAGKKEEKDGTDKPDK